MRCPDGDNLTQFQGEIDMGILQLDLFEEALGSALGGS